MAEGAYTIGSQDGPMIGGGARRNGEAPEDIPKWVVELKRKLEEVVRRRPGLYVYCCPQAPGRDGYTLFQPCLDPDDHKAD